MENLYKDELGFLRTRKRERVTSAELRRLLEATPDEEIYQARVKNGVRTAVPLNGKTEVNVNHGDTLSVGPRITKAADAAVEQLRREVQGLERAGYGGIGKPVKKEWGWELYLNGLILPGGIRTDALILVPLTYPAVGPIGFYVRKEAAKGNLDQHHLLTNGYEGARTIPGWQWFCGVAQNWKPGRYTLVTYISIVLSLFNEHQDE